MTQTDAYTRILLTTIAVCLVLITLRMWVVETPLKAATALSCTGDAKANEYGGTAEMFGGYAIRLKCE